MVNFLRIKPSHRCMCCLILLLFTAVRSRSSGSSSGISNSFRSNPYEVLGVTKSATQKEIQQQYRALCLKHHPDKNRDSGTEEDDFAFKEVQHAYSLIGTQEDRKKYDLTSRFSAYTSNSEFMRNPNGFASPDNFGAGPSMYFKFGSNGPTFRFYQSQYQRSYARSFHFHSPYTNNPQFGDAAATATPKRSHYVQKVVVPLEKLYTGSKMEFNLTTSIIERYKAAHRGRFLMPLASQALLAVLTTWLKSQKINWFLSLFLFVTIVHFNLPPVPSKKSYPTTIKAGSKAGTKIKYSVDGPDCASDVTFVIQEGHHEMYKRVGNDLHTTISVKARRLRKGCTVYIDPLSSEEDPIKVKLRRDEVTADGQVVVIKGRGWPNANASGDLHVKVRIKA